MYPAVALPCEPVCRRPTASILPRQTCPQLAVFRRSLSLASRGTKSDSLRNHTAIYLGSDAPESTWAGRRVQRCRRHGDKGQ